MSAVTVPADKLAELQRKAKLVDELVEALENVIDLAESIRLSGDAGDWCWEEGDEFTTAVQLLRKVKGK